MFVLFKHFLPRGCYTRRNKQNWHHLFADLFNAHWNLRAILVFEGGLTLVQEYSTPWPQMIEQIQAAMSNMHWRWALKAWSWRKQ